MGEVAIIGAGPAGCAAALQLKRLGIDSLLIEKERVGGLLLNANLVQNYPGFPTGITGLELSRLLGEHLARLNVEVLNAEVTELHYLNSSAQPGGTFLLTTTKGEFRSPIVVVASGTRPRRLTALAIPDEAVHRVLYEIYPILATRGKRIAIIGGGDAAFDYALTLAKLENEITILNRTSRKRCVTSLWQKATQEGNIVYEDNIRVASLTSMGDGLAIQCRRTSNVSITMQVDYLVIAAGRSPRTDFITERTKKIIPHLVRHRRLYLVGDVKRGVYRQVAIAVGDGVYAAMKIRNALRRGTP